MLLALDGAARGRKGVALPFGKIGPFPWHFYVGDAVRLERISITLATAPPVRLLAMSACMVAVFAMRLAISVGGANGDSCVEFAAGGPGTLGGKRLRKLASACTLQYTVDGARPSSPSTSPSLCS